MMANLVLLACVALAEPGPLDSELKAAMELLEGRPSANVLVQVRTLAVRLSDADRYDDAAALCRAAALAARKAKDADAARQFGAMAKEADEAAKAKAACDRALAVLKDSPADEEANFTVGKYLCAVKRQWKRGVPMLALGGRGPAPDAAAKELKGGAALDLGDAWRAVGEPWADRRAAYWYAKAEAEATGLAKLQAAERLAALGKDALEGGADAEEASATKKPAAAGVAGSPHAPPGPGGTPAVVRVEGMTPVPFEAEKYPRLGKGAVAWRFAKKPGTDVKNGVVEFQVDRGGLLYLMADYSYQGNPGGGWADERLTRDGLAKTGWEDLGETPWDKNKVMFRKSVKAGEKYRIRTNKYWPPTVIVPGR